MRPSGRKTTLFSIHVQHLTIFLRSSQSVLETICSVRTSTFLNYPELIASQTFDGVRMRCLPVLYKSLDLTVDDDRMKGALYTLNTPAFGEIMRGPRKIPLTALYSQVCPCRYAQTLFDIKTYSPSHRSDAFQRVRFAAVCLSAQRQGA